MTDGSSGWYGYLDVLREASELAQQERDEEPQACPEDGEPLVRGDNGALYCPFDGWLPA